MLSIFLQSMILKIFRGSLTISFFCVSTICGFAQAALANTNEHQQKIILFPINSSSYTQMQNKIFEVLIVKPSPSDRPVLRRLNEDDEIQHNFNQEVKRIRMLADNNKEIEVIFDQNWFYPTEIKSCGFFEMEGAIKKSYVLLAILRKKEDVENNDLVPTQIKISSFLKPRGHRLAERNLEDALSYLLAKKIDSGENVIYKFKFEYGSTYCQP
jgi:hypothetical protein